MKNSIIGASVAAMLVCAGQAGADVTYQVDDNTAETNVGVPGAAISWGNMFSVQVMGELITDISFGFGIDQVDQTLVGESIEWRIWGDADADPTSGMNLLAGGTHVIVNDGFIANGLLDVIGLGGGLDVSGDDFFFVAATYVDDNDGSFPASLDTDSDLGQSWAAISGDPLDWSAGGLIGGFGLPGNWVVRANGTVPAPASAMTLGLAGLLGTRRRRK